MKQMAFRRVLTVLACALMLCSLAPMLGVADTAQYFYDPLGRLAAVVDGQGNVATYQYDAVGNLLSISRGPATAPSVTALTPNLIDAGTPTSITITGTGLQLAALSSANPDVAFSNVVVTNVQIKATANAFNPTTFGAAMISVTSPGGTTSLPLTVRQPTPILTRATPAFGRAGTTITLDGSGFGTTPGGNRVTFSGTGGVRLPGQVSFSSSTRIRVIVPSGITFGTLTVEVGALTSNSIFFSVPGISAIASTATRGTPLVATAASANIGQTVQLQGGGFTASSLVNVPTINDVGVVTPVQFNVLPGADGTTATITAFSFFTTGSWSLVGGDLPGVLLQIVPTLDSISLPSGSTFTMGSVLRLTGSGFKEGGTTISFPGVPSPIPATDVSSGTFQLNTELTVTIPQGVTPGSLTLNTDGGTSNPLSVPVLSSITSVALRGVPGSPAVASANVGQTIQLHGTGFTPGVQVLFPSTNDAGVSSIVPVPLFNISQQGTVASATIPFSATTGSVTIAGLGSVPLQIVPTVTTVRVPIGQSFAPGVVVTVEGSGFKEGGTTITFPGASSVSATDVFNTNFSFTVTVPPGATNIQATVTVDGSSDTFDNVRPSVTSVIPSNNQNGIPLNSRVVLTFDEPIIPTTINGSSFVVSGVAGPLAGVYRVATDRRSASFTPSQPLPANSGFSVAYSGITDVAGNVLLNPGFVAFATGTATDTTGPLLVGTSPSDGMNEIPTNRVIRATYNESLFAPSVNAQAVQLTSSAGTVPAIISLEATSSVIRIQPLVLLQADTAYSVSIGTGLEDMAGNTLLQATLFSFTTGTAPDAILPTVTAVVPSDGASNVSPDTSVQVTFSEPIAPASINTANTFVLTGGGFTGNIPGSFSVSTDHQVVTFTPSAPLFAGQTYILTLSGIEDTSGNRLATFSSSFTTLADTGGGVVPASAFVFATPSALFANGQTITRVTIDNIADANGFLVPDGTRVAVTAAPAFQQTSAGGTILGGTISMVDPRFTVFTTASGRVRFDYQSPALVLAPGFSASGVIQVANLTPAGIPSNLIGTSPITLVTSQTASITFNPQTLLPNGTSQAEITVVVRDPINTLDDFGRPIPAGTVMGVGVLSAQGPLGTINGGTAAPDPRYKLFSAKTGGIIDLTYTAPNLVQGPTDGNSEMFSAIQVDPAGNLLGAFGSSFIGLVTGGCVGNECVSGGFTGPLPKVLAMSPAPGETVGTNATIMVKFGQNLNPATVTPSTFTVTRGGIPVAGTFAFSASDKGPDSIVTFTPGAPWVSGTVTDVTLTTGIKNTAGNPLLASSFTNFSIDAGPDTTGPAVVRASLGNGLTDVPHSAVINIQFNQPVNAVTLNNTNLTVSAGGTPISGRISLSNGEFGVNTIATFIQDQLLASDTLYTITMTSGVTDASSNPLSPTFTSTFRTAAGTPVTDVGQPNVDSVSPTNFQFDVPLNPTIQVRMDKPINPLTLNSGSFGLSSNFQPVEGTVAFAPDQNSWTFAPTAPLAPTTSHFVDVTNTLRDIAGNRLYSPIRSDFFTGTALANPAGPQITSVTPQNNATNVFLNQPIKVRFSEPLAVATVTNQTVVVTRAGVPVSGVVTLLDNNRMIHWVPANGGTLAPNALHTLTITTGVTGLASNPLSAPLTFSFTTGTATDTTAPAVTNINPLDGAQEVPRNQQIEVIFNEPIDPASAQAGFFLEHTDSGVSIAGAFTLSQDRTTIQFIPTFSLFAGQTFSIVLNGITDSVGNQLAFASSTFTTAVAPGTNLGAVPDSGTVLVDNNFLPADGQATTVVTINDITRGGVPVPDGAVIGVTAAPVFQSSVGGTIVGGTPSAADSRVSLFTVVGGSVTLTYQAPNLSVVNDSAKIQVSSVDAAGAPMRLIGSGEIFFEGGPGI